MLAWAQPHGPAVGLWQASSAQRQLRQLQMTATFATIVCDAIYNAGCNSINDGYHCYNDGYTSYMSSYHSYNDGYTK